MLGANSKFAKRKLGILPAKTGHDACGIGGVLKQADGGNSRGTGGNARGGVCKGNSADGEDGNIHGVADGSETVEALR